MFWSILGVILREREYQGMTYPFLQCSSPVRLLCVVQRLQKEHRKQAGISDTPTGAMYGECQELLQMFGLPYIIAPMEV